VLVYRDDQTNLFEYLFQLFVLFFKCDSEVKIKFWSNLYILLNPRGFRW
jgi:hypothetical protein